MIYPQRLQKGDTIGVIAPAGPPNQKYLAKGIQFFKNMGLHVKLGNHIDDIYGYLAGTDDARLHDFNQMIADAEVKAIIFARGGYGTARIAPTIDYDLIRTNPKIIWGYSDITYLHTAIRQATGLVTFHGPMVVSDVGREDFDELSASMFEQLFAPTKLIYTERISTLQVLVPGSASGKLVGGNLSLLASTLGTDYEIDTTDKLLLIEDIGEEPYAVDSMLNQLKLSGKLDQAAGIIVGDFAKTESKMEHSLSLEQVFDHYLKNLHCPVMAGFKIGHCFPHFAVPLGVEATISTNEETLEIKPGVK